MIDCFDLVYCTIMYISNIWLIMVLFIIRQCNCNTLPSDLDVFEFGSREHAFGGLRWDNTFNHPTPYQKPIKETMSTLFQYLRPETMPIQPFPMNQFSICWNLNSRVFGWDQSIIMRLFHEKNTEWRHSNTNVNGDYWLQLNFSPDRGTLIMTASMINDKTKNNIWSGGLGVGNYTTADNPLLRWGSFCIANDFKKCWTRYFIGICELCPQHRLPSTQRSLYTILFFFHHKLLFMT